MQQSSAKVPIKVLIVDDQTLFATSLRLVLENTETCDFEIVGIAANGRECLEKLSSVRPDVILMDVYMPELDGVETAAIVHRDYPAIKIMMLTTFDDDVYVKKSLRSGVSGYVLKTIDAEDLIMSIKAVYQGLVLVSPSVSAKFFNQDEASSTIVVDPHIRRLQTRFPELKSREAEILYLILKGFSNQQSAGKLLIAEQTVRNYSSSIYTKIGVEDRLNAIQLFSSLKDF
ncbi:MAG: response regulator transcription factor [Treponemataceae bacterium]